MTSNLTRRDFLTLATGAAILESACGSVAAATPNDAPFDTVVVLMMENRSFDHVLGWLPGANGKQEGLRYTDTKGIEHQTWPLAPEWQGCRFNDPDHTWQGTATQYADGRCDGFLQTAPVGDR